MKSIINEIIALRNGKLLTIDHRNQNRYCVVSAEKNGTKTAYCFAVPIYNNRTKKLVNLKYYDNCGTLISFGSSATISVNNKITLKDEYGFCEIQLPEIATQMSWNSVKYGNTEVSPTLNGILVKTPCKAYQKFDINIFSGQSFMPVWSNDRCFSLMRDEFKPFITVSCIGVLDNTEQMISPCGLEYQKNNDKEYTISVKNINPYSGTLFFEINLHAEKMFQDTTVENIHPDVNNAFGGIAYIGKTAAYGEQWLYSRIDFSKIPELFDKKINEAVLYMPGFGGDAVLTAFGLSTRFCSFGSNWDNKVMSSRKLGEAVFMNGYQRLNITEQITDDFHFLKLSEGLILRSKSNCESFSAVSTGDSYFAPQILEVNFR